MRGIAVATIVFDRLAEADYPYVLRGLANHVQCHLALLAALSVCVSEVEFIHSYKEDAQDQCNDDAEESNAMRMLVYALYRSRTIFRGCAGW